MLLICAGVFLRNVTGLSLLTTRKLIGILPLHVLLLSLELNNLRVELGLSQSPRWIRHIRRRSLRHTSEGIRSGMLKVVVGHRPLYELRRRARLVVEFAQDVENVAAKTLRGGAVLI